MIDEGVGVLSAAESGEATRVDLDGGGPFRT